MNFPIDRTLSPLDKLASHTQQLNQTNNNNNNNNNNQTKQKDNKLFYKTPPSSFSLTPISSTHSFIPHQSNNNNNNNNNNKRSTFNLNSALSQLTDSLNQLEHQLPIHPRRPSTGRVNSSTATTQTPREHIPSYYGDQHSISSFESSSEQQQQQQQTNHQQQTNENHHHIDQQSQEVLNSPNSHQIKSNNHHQTWTSSSPSESESEIDAQSTYYPSGLSLASEDPFQYRHYEASRQSRQPIQQSEPPPTTHPVQPPTSERSTNFSRPLRKPSIPPSPASLTSSQSQTDDHSPPSDHQPPGPNATLQAHFSNRDSESHYSADYLADTRDILTKGRTAQFESSHPKRSDSKASSLRSLGRAARSSIQSRSSVDTTSSSGSRLSWKKLFDFGSNSNQNTATQENHLALTPNQPSNNLPEITFSQSDLERNTQDHYYSSNHSDMPNYHHHHHHHHKLNQIHQTGEPRVDVRPLHQTSYRQSTQEEIRGLSPNDNSQNKRNHRLSIYSLPSSDDLPPAELDGKQRYASRSPITFDGSDSSQVPSPISDEASRYHQAVMGNSQPPSRQQQSQQHHHHQQQQQQPPSRPASSIHHGGNSNGMQLHSAIKKAKATLAVTNLKGFKSQGQTAQDYLQAGIEAHERGDLERSAGLFERAAREGGGCGAGMLMWGLSLRHGWGCQVNEVRAFKWLQKAAESVIEDLDPKAKQQQQTSSSLLTLPSPQSSSTKDQQHHSHHANGDKDQVAKSELILAIYELGQCFMRGWGCKKDKQLAISYFELAAKLGDPDAQQELGFCYTNGKGTKKDLKLAAKYYRMAAKQGVEMMGTQWIWKDKYN